MKKENIINRPPGLTFFCIMLLLGSIGGSLGLPVLFLGFGGPLIFLPFIEGLFIFNFYLVYNIWNLRKKSWVLIKIWLLTIFFFAGFPTLSAKIFNAPETAFYTLLLNSYCEFFVIGIIGYYLYKQKHLFVR